MLSQTVLVQFVFSRLEKLQLSLCGDFYFHGFRLPDIVYPNLKFTRTLKHSILFISFILYFLFKFTLKIYWQFQQTTYFSTYKYLYQKHVDLRKDAIPAILPLSGNAQMLLSSIFSHLNIGKSRIVFGGNSERNKHLLCQETI